MSSNDIPMMSVRVGGRLFKPALAKPAKVSPPTPLELKFNETLTEFTSENIAVESGDGIRRRERVLNVMGQVCREWIQSVCAEKGLQAEVIQAAGGEMFTSGSYRLGVHEPGADIDTILVAPQACEREDFFGTSKITDEDDPTARDPNSLAERIRRHPDVTNFNPVETAAIPLLTFDWEGINIDLLFARLNSNSVPPGLDIDNDNVLNGVDGATEKSLNGPRVTNLIAAFVKGQERYPNFLAVVRCVRKWAKARGLYNNKMGYWGGVNINMAVAVVVQLYPNACPATLLRMFFLVFKSWKWPRPVMLTEPYDAGFGPAVWNPQTANRQIAPMITPAYPAMNSTLSASRQTMRIMQEEFERGHAIVDGFWKTFQMNPGASIDWSILFQPSDFFISYPHYLSLCIVGPTQEDAQAWAGFVESRLRKLVSDNLARSLPLKKIQLWPKKIEACVADKTVLLTQAQRQNSMTYFVGFRVDNSRMRGDHLNAELAMQNFREWELGRFQPLVPGMDVLTKCFKTKELPNICFEEIYEGGKLEAMRKRRTNLNNDPERLARKAEELRSQKAEIERKLEEKRNKSKNKKRKALEEGRKEDSDEDGGTPTAKKQKVANESSGDDANAADNQNQEVEEADLLEDALGATGDEMTREEAEAKKRELLTGDIDEGEEDADSDDEVGYTGDGARQMSYKKVRKDIKFKNKRCLPPSEHNAELIRKLGGAIVTDDESKVIGTSTSWSSRKSETKSLSLEGPMKIIFKRSFDIVELDSHGHVIDKGDEDYMPSKSWTGRKAGFEFKLGERGLGYYRTGKKVQVPSNTAY